MCVVVSVLHTLEVHGLILSTGTLPLLSSTYRNITSVKDASQTGKTSGNIELE